ncbi:hypothetical protein FHX48_001532 [Microbacterium halimionae]|uniref:TIGR01777 family protein n=1 Tax=Microbacterium halimionae TaxID=1526413 RepID=A0A7W3JP66_9MICO|nr:TIGR01777 family oxidoreductase [Microbacterium halimionae]MBA8816459.1 hypothetical protein [Microbacterium halimionae]NII95354.1 hypothetical protein [Microbacterium halimionae]
MPDQSSSTPGRVVLAGASGLIGTALAESFRADGFTVTTLVRREARNKDEVSWLTDSTPFSPDVLAGAKAVIGLNGASVGHFPWTKSYKSTLLWSRITPTRALASAVRQLGDDAPTFISASASGYYGAFPKGVMTESGPQGSSFLAELCGEWESAALHAGGKARVALMRTAPIVHPEGVLRPLLLLTKLGVSGPLGRGTQVWPWISLDDEIRGIRHILDAEITGPVNFTAPTRTTANDLGFALARRMNRPYFLRAPEWALRAALGADATEALLTTDADVKPEVLEKSGFEFRYPTVEEAVAAVVPEC